MDVAINGEGWIAVQGADGQETYTRAGDLRVTPEGFLQTGTGEAVLGEEGPIVIPDADKIDIGSDGTITIIPLGEDATTLLNVDRIRLVKPDLKDLEKQNDGLLHLKAGAEPPVVDASISLLQGAVEGSNVGAVAAMVEMIELSKTMNYKLR